MSGVCSVGLIEGFISPVELAGYLMAFCASFFIFFPAQYFNSWFKYIFSWAFPVSIVLVNALHSETSWLVISKTDVVRLLGMVFGIVTVIFVVVKWYRARR